MTGKEAWKEICSLFRPDSEQGRVVEEKIFPPFGPAYNRSRVQYSNLGGNRSEMVYRISDLSLRLQEYNRKGNLVVFEYHDHRNGNVTWHISFQKEEK